MREGAPRDRRRLALWAVATVIAVVVLVVVPGYLSAQPGFFTRYPGLKVAYGTWHESTHVETRCEQCHVSPKPLPQAAYRARMLGEFYASLVSRERTPGVFGAPTNDSCMKCHYELRTVSPQGDLQIPHRAHVEILKMECVACHDYAVHEKSPEGRHTPPMSGCMKCHDGETAKGSCSACHTEKALPDSHRSEDWLVEHPDRAKTEDCESCHAWIDEWCVDCHTRKPRSHDGDWRATHRDQVAKHRSCEACHGGDFCVRCHGEVPQANYDADLKLVQ